MSWDVVIFNLRKKVNSIAEIDDSVIIPFPDWDTIRLALFSHFKDISWDGVWGSVNRPGFSITFCSGDPEERPENMMMSLYGEHAIYEIVELCRKCNWQVYDTCLGEMIDLENPERQGYADFQAYLQQVKMYNG